ncbi:MAG: hypothetical protein JO252_16445 [Planctomycetaceae bacterium]|nr:hypothetical protein [Planctomycetaceae bacterium]
MHDHCQLEQRRTGRPNPHAVEMVRRARLLLLIMLGHKSPKIRDGSSGGATAEFGLTRIFPGGAAFDLPRRTVVR